MRACILHVAFLTSSMLPAREACAQQQPTSIPTDLALALLDHGESISGNRSPKIVVGRIEPIEPPVLDRALDVLRRAAEAQDERAVRHCLSALIPDANLIMPPDDAGGVLEVEPEVKLRHSRTG